MNEDQFVEIAFETAKKVLAEPLTIERGASLLYQITVDNRLHLTVDPRNPKRGSSAFQTDLCVFERVDEETRIPRVVLEFKSRLTTHSALTYSAKARKHKQIYPYLRYGLVVSQLERLPGRFFTHNEAFDFGVAAHAYRKERLADLFSRLLKAEVDASRQLERIMYGRESVQIYRAGIEVWGDDRKVS